MKRLTKTSVVCLVALSHGHLIRTGQHWLFERNRRYRLFSSATVNGLIALGLATRDGNIVRAA